jgi:chromatin remodeling complex protein RSC6
MPRQSKTTKTSTETETVVSAAVSEPVVSTPVDKVVKAPRTKKPKTEVAAPVENVVISEQVLTAQTVPSQTEESAVEVDTEVPVAEQSVEFLAKLQQLGVLISSIKAEYRTLEKKWSRELKSAQKQSSKRKRKAGNRAPSGFVKPTRISDELAKFLDKPAGSEMARTEVTRDINKYIRTHNLQDKENGRKINPDSKLAALLKLKKSDELTYFNLQRYMSPHFAKATKEATV